MLSGEEIWKSLLTLPDQHWAMLDNLEAGVNYSVRLVASNGHHTRMSDTQTVILPPIPGIYMYLYGQKHFVVSNMGSI